MNINKAKQCTIFLCFLFTLLFVSSLIGFIGDAPAAENGSVNTFKIFGEVNSVDYEEKSFTLKGGNTFHTTQQTSIETMQNRTASFAKVITINRIIIVITKIIDGKHIAIAIRESGKG